MWRNEKGSRCRKLGLKREVVVKDFIVDKETFVMCSEPSPELTAEMVEQSIATIETELELATLFAAVENKAWWIEDEEYDYNEGTEEYLKAKENTDLWFSLADKLRDRIFNILLSEGIEIPRHGQIVVLEPFMKRNGFRNGQGWWIKND